MVLLFRSGASVTFRLIEILNATVAVLSGRRRRKGVSAKVFSAFFYLSQSLKFYGFFLVFYAHFTCF